MKYASLGITFLLIFSTFAFLAVIPSTSAKSCTTTISSENPGNNAIQSAIDAVSPGSIICVGPGTFPEQLTITQPITLAGSGSANTIIQPTAVTDNAPGDPTTGLDAVIAVLGTTDVTITNLVIDGSVAAANDMIGGQSDCGGPKYAGVLFSDASGVVADTLVENFYQSDPSLYGCQTNFGLGIDVESPGSTPSIVTITNNVVSNYQKNGITCNAGLDFPLFGLPQGSLSTCAISNNIVTALSGATYPGLGGTNGIQVGFGAVASVSNNVVSDNQCGTDFVPDTCGHNFSDQTGTNIANDAAGILLTLAGGGTSVTNNQISENDIGIEVYGPNGGVNINNNVLSNNLFAGITVEDGSYVVKNTQISGGYLGVGVFALSTFGDSSSSVTLHKVDYSGVTVSTGSFYSPGLSATVTIK